MTARYKHVETILRMLEADCRLTTAQLAERSGMTEDAVRAVIAEAEAKGILRRYKAVVDWERAGVDPVTYAFIEVKVMPQREVGFDEVANRIMRFDEVHSLYLMSGTYDLHVVVGGKDIRAIATFVATKLAPLEGVQGTATHFVLKRFKMDGDLMEEPEQSERLPYAM
jgi:DNA-binding Lrp family transcriptional regulator